MTKSVATADLIEDHELPSAEGDRLNHEAFARQLADLSCSTTTPANIALFGPWGSGKSSVGSILGEVLKDAPNVKYVRFDAFKYAQDPLRRNFISVTAESLGKSSEKVVERLYATSTENDLKINGPGLRSALSNTLKVVLGLAVAIGLVVGVIALGSCIASGWGPDGWNGEPYLERWADLMRTAFPALVLSAGVVAAVLTLVGKTFAVERRQDPVASDEAFEKAFSDVLREATPVLDRGKTRFVFFIDELDRCQPNEVVETLSAIRTFFGVKRCVFIVAADRQVVERALNIASNQATPLDDVHPYYSEGSEYLDKVFQYQLSLPPLFPQTITRFALDVVDGRGGIWSKVQPPAVISALIPSHVRSPRRVKHLLNAYALAARAAISRQEAGLIDSVFPERALELARLVCLQVEFPALAHDLADEPALPAMILAVDDWLQLEMMAEMAADPETPLSSEAARKAALSRYPEDDWWASHDWAGVPLRTRRRAFEYATGLREPAQVLADGSSTPGRTRAAVVAVQSQQLLSYLTRTRRIEGPKRDLIYLKTLGAAYGLPATLADSLSAAAEDGRTSVITSAIREGADGAAVLDLLSDLQLSTLPGENVALCLVSAAAAMAEVPRTQAVRVGAVWQFTGLPLPVSAENGESLAGGLLALSTPAGGTQEADAIEKFILEDPHLRNTNAGWHLMGQDRWAVARAKTVAPTFFAAMQEPGAVERMGESGMSDEALASLLRSARPLIKDLPHDAEASSTLGSNLLEALDSARSEAALHAVVEALLDMSSTEPLPGLRDVLNDLAPIRDIGLACRLATDGMRYDDLSAWPAWIAAVAPDVRGDERFRRAVGATLPNAWKAAIGDESGEDIGASLSSIAKVLRGSEPTLEPNAALEAEVAKTLEGQPVQPNGGNALERARTLLLLQAFAAEGFCNVETHVEAEAASLADLLMLGVGAQPAGSALDQYVTAAVDFLSASLEPLSADAAARLRDGIAASPWIGVPTRIRLQTRLSGTVLVEAAPVPEADGLLRSYAASQGPTPEVQNLIANWLRTLPSASRVLAVADAIFPYAPLSDDFLAGMRAWANGVDVAERHLLVDGLLDVTRSSLPNEALWTVVRLSDQPGGRICAALGGRATAATTTEGATAILDVARRARLSGDPDVAALWRQVLVALLDNATLGEPARETVLDCLVELLKPVPERIRAEVKDRLSLLREAEPALQSKVDDVLKSLFPKTKWSWLPGADSD